MISLTSSSSSVVMPAFPSALKFKSMSLEGVKFMQEMFWCDKPYLICDIALTDHVIKQFFLKF